MITFFGHLDIYKMDKLDLELNPVYLTAVCFQQQRALTLCGVAKLSGKHCGDVLPELLNYVHIAMAVLK